MTNDRVEIMWAERAIGRVVLAYARAVDALDLAKLRDCFHPDARIHYGEIFSGPRDEALDWLENSLSRLQGTMHDFGAPMIELDLARGRATCETYATNAARFPADADGRVLLNLTGTRYFDVFERRDEDWRILERRNQISWTQNVYEIPTPPPPFMVGSPRQR